MCCLFSGAYEGEIDVTSDGGNKSIPVTVNIGPGQLTVSPELLDFGSQENSQTFTISNVGQGIAKWSINVDQAWLHVEPAQGETCTEIDTVVVSVDRELMTLESNEGTITITSDSDDSLIHVEVEPCGIVIEEIAAMHHAHNPGGTMGYNSKLYVWSDDTRDAGLEVYEPLTDTWTTNNDIPIARKGLTRFTLDGDIYFIGEDYAENTSSINSVCSYDISQDQWDRLRNFPISLWYGLSAVVNDKAYVFGGVDGFGRTNPQVYKYNKEYDSWGVSANNMPISVYMTGAVTYKGKIYVIGGTHCESKVECNFIPKIQIYDPTTNAWEIRTMPDNVVFTSAAIQSIVYCNKIYVFIREHNMENTYVYSYSPDTEEWLEYTIDLPSPSSYIQLVNEIVIIDGYAYFTDIVTDGVHSNKVYRMKLCCDSPNLSVSMNDLDFSDSVTDLTFTISNTGLGKLSWSISADQEWLRIDPNYLSNDTYAELDTIGVSVNRDCLAAGQYSGKIHIISNGGESTINVSMEVVPKLSVSTDSLDFGDSINDVTFAISNKGQGKLSWSMTSDQKWLRIDPNYGPNFTCDEVDTIWVVVDRDCLPAGQYLDEIHIFSNGGEWEINVSMEVTPQLFVSTPSLDFGDSINDLTFAISNKGQGSLGWSISPDQKWLRIDPNINEYKEWFEIDPNRGDYQQWVTVMPDKGATCISDDVITVSVMRSDLICGIYKTAIFITSNGGDAMVDVKMEVNDKDGDGIPDNRDAFQDNPNEWEDTDVDNIGDNSDNCPHKFNPDQRDLDRDGIGNMCDPDIDGDGYEGPFGNNNNEDCDDHDRTIYPGAEETCDGIDNDCDCEIDEENACTLIGKIVFERNGDIWIMNDDGSNQMNLTNSSDVMELFPSFSPDGSKIVYVKNYFSNSTDSELYSMNSDGTDNVPLYTSTQFPISPSPFGMIHSTAWSPAQDKIIFSHGDPNQCGISTITIDGSQVKSYPFHEGWQIGRPSYSQDGTEIVYSQRSLELSYFTEIWLMDADGSAMTQLISSENCGYSCENDNPHFSPDGLKIVYDSGEYGKTIGDTMYPHDIYSMDADGSHKVRLTTDPAWDQKPAWSPDGREILFIRERDIWKMNADGSNQIQLTLTNDLEGTSQPNWAYVPSPPVAPSSRQFDWAIYLGGTGSDVANKILIDREGNVYVTGGRFRTSGPTAGTEDMFLSKFTKQGFHIWTEWLGGNQSDTGVGLSFDSNENIYVLGKTDSDNFPITPGVYQMVFGGNSDGFLAKFNSDGKLLWSTYIGGNDRDYATDINVDTMDNIYVVGYTKSTYIPGPAGYNTNHAGQYDGLILKFDSDGRLLWYTYLGTSEDEYMYSLLVDGKDLYVAGTTSSSSNFPAISEGYFSTYRGGSLDGFLTKVDSDNKGGPVWSTYLGGSAWDQIYTIASDQNNNTIYVCGTTGSADFPTSHGLYTSFSGGYEDGYITCFTKDCNLLWSTYLGGSSGKDTIGDIAISADGEIFFSGFSEGGFPLAENDPLGEWDAIVGKLDEDGILSWSRYLGGGSSDVGLSLALDTNNSIYISGSTYSSDFQPVPNIYDTGHGGKCDGFLVKLIKSSVLIAHFPFTGDANDWSINGNDGLAKGATLTTDRYGNANSAYSFDGVDDYIWIPFISPYNLQPPFTLMAWVKPSSFPPGLNAMAIMCKSFLNRKHYYLSINNFGIGFCNKEWAANVPLDEWSHIAVTIQEYNLVDIMLNGEIIAQGTIDQEMGEDRCDLSIGVDMDGSLENFHGAIDDVRIYDRALSQCEVQDLVQ
ncbi:MAG: SBBP repeat-containing protein [bacterium]